MDDVCIRVLNILTLRYTFPIKTASGFDRRKNTFYTYSIYHKDTLLPNYEKRQKYIFISDIIFGSNLGNPWFETIRPWL